MAKAQSVVKKLEKAKVARPGRHSKKEVKQTKDF